MRRFLWIGLAVLGAAALLFWLNQAPLPQGTPGEQADKLAKKIEQAVALDKWHATDAVLWSHNGKRELLWDKRRGLCRVRWANNEVLIRLHDQSGLAWEEGKPLEGEALSNALNQAWKYWINDSFWLNPLAKLFDDGVQRSLVELETGDIGLKVSYTSGGVTPGDSYLWIVDKQGRPTACRMWVSNIAVKGIEFSWEGWTQIGAGAWVGTLHNGPTFSLSLPLVKAGSIAEASGEAEPFAALQP